MLLLLKIVYKIISFNKTLIMKQIFFFLNRDFFPTNRQVKFTYTATKYKENNCFT